MNLDKIDLSKLNPTEQKLLASLLREKTDRETFNKLDTVHPYEWQLNFFGKSKDNAQILAMCANRVGKEQPISEPVLTPAGWVPIGEIKPGMEVIGSDGTPVQVVAVHPQGVKDVYEVSFTDGAKVRCGLDHLWTVRKSRKWETLSVKEMLEDFKPAIMPARPVVEAPKSELPVDPYLLGLLLGDGCLTQAFVGISTADPEIVDYCQTAAHVYGCELKYRSQYDYTFSGPASERNEKGQFQQSNNLKQRLVNLGLQGKKSYDKFVPKIYFQASPEQRLALVQGLMDSDGTVGKDNGARSFSTTSKQLAIDFVELTRSIGESASMQFKVRKSGFSWNVNIFCGPVSMFRLRRKQEKEKLRPRKNIRLVGIRKLDYQEESVCIEVDSKDHLYVTKDHILTHNTYSGATALAIHLTGLYPDWWNGRRFKRPIRAWAAGISHLKTRDIVQKELMGPPEDHVLLGSGMIPKSCIISTTRKFQVNNAFETVLIQHYDEDGVPDGHSRLMFLSYEMGEQKFMGESMDYIWLDEQPPSNIFTQCITRTADTSGLVVMTFTPEDGVTPVVHQFMNDIKPGQALVQATWDDVPHLDEKTKEQLLAVYSPNEREMRSKGIPIFGGGPVFPIHLEESIRIEPFELPQDWPRIAGIDFGWEHPTAVVWAAWNREADVVYIHDIYSQSKTTPIIHAAAINSRARVPVAWPHDGYKHEQGSGTTLADQYRQQGVYMLPWHFTNPLAPGETGKGNIRVEPGIMDLYQRMETGRLKVFRTCSEWFEEFRWYHREDGKIVDVKDDLMSATRYAVQSIRFAELPSAGSSWKFDSKIEYDDSWIV